MGDEHLISKKEVLEQMGISYGQLYRWKRKGLIPEAWFIRRSTFTGQETFFPRDKIIERIDRIKNMKGEHALDDLADVITEHVNAKLQVAFARLQKLNWFDENLARSAGVMRAGDETLSLRDAFRLAVLKRLRRAARDEEIALASDTLRREADKGADLAALDGKTLHLLRKQLSGGGITAEISVIVIAADDLIVDPEMRRVDAVDLTATLQQVKLDLAGCGEPESAPSEQDSQGRHEHE